MTAQPAPGIPHTPTEGAVDADDGLTGDEYWEEIKAFQADLAEYCRAVDVEGCTCIPRPKFPALADRNRWCREHGLLALVPAELTQSISGIRGGEPCMLNTRVPVEDVATLLEDGATWDFVKETYPSIPTPAGTLREAAQPPTSSPGTVQESMDRGTGDLRPHDSLQTIDGRQLTGPEVISRVLVLAFGTRHNREHIGELADHLDAALRIVHYREVVASLRKIADADEKAEPPIGGEVDYLRGWRHAANRIESVVKDLEDGDER